MVRPIESEIKLTASPKMLKKLRRHPKLAGADQTATLITTYFDTIGARLRHGGATLRIRDDGKGREQTFKLVSPDKSSVRRGEWNVAAAGDLPEPSGFPVKARTALTRLLDGATVEPIGTTRIDRTTRRLHFGGSIIEIAFDLGTIRAGEREEAVCELEMELVEGKLADVLGLALHLPLGPELSWSVSSKAERCHLLAFDLPPAAVHSRPVKLSPDIDVANGYQAIAWNCLDQLLANYPLVIASGDPESLHQSRVAIRRLRAADSLFGDVVDGEATPVLHAELKAVAMGLGPVRDLHVLLVKVASVARAGDHDVSELLAYLGTRRDAAMRSVQALLAAGPFQRLLFELAGWIENGEWLARKEETRGDQPLAPFAAHMLSRRRRKLRRLRDQLAEMPDAARHRLRIDVKKLRYAAEFVTSLYRGRATAKHSRTFAKALGQLQDSLGEFNDIAVAAAGRNALFEELEPIAAAGLAAQLKSLIDEHVKSRRKLLKAAERSLVRIIGGPTWWKSK